ncbi:MAG TPA: Crp/Fnr family transcriptional regulator [Limnochordia bacterium]|nr:Crp/Fnr family transcriptional regulator [Limnochordia bacterium]
MTAEVEAITRVLGTMSYFKEVPRDDLLALASACRRINLATGETLYVEGEACSGLYCLIAGRIRAVRYSPGGRQLVLRAFAPGETFNEVGVLEGGTNPATATAAEASEVLIIPTPALRRLLEQHPHVDLRILRGLAAKLHYLVAKLSQHAFLDVRGRLIAHLLEQADAAGVIGPVSQETLAAQLGTVRQVVGRALSELQRAGAIQINREHVTIVDSALLRELAGDR